ncbi:MAG: outer membrane protein assembly factor BamA [Campylobacterales bacterium]|nr:outer membrane protein assembly factor BamA [Campylobacterales bacterium]
MKKSLFLCTLTCSLMYAQNIKDIKFEGLIHLSEDTAKELIGYEESKNFNDDKISDSIKKLFAQGYFEDIFVTEDKNVLTYHFKEKPIIAKVTIKGYRLKDAEDEKQDTKEIGVRKGDLYDDDKVTKIKQKLKEKIEAEGYYDTVVEVSSVPINENAIELIVEVNKGEQIIIKEANYFGNRVLEEDDFENVVANKEAEFLGWLWGRNDSVAKIDELKYDSSRIKDLYMKNGYLDAQCSEPFFRVDFNTYNAKLSYSITEGEQYSVSSIDIIVDENIITKQELLDDAVKLKIGKPFNVDELRKDMDRIKEKVANLGYAFVQVQPDFEKIQDKKEVSISYKIVSGDKVYIRDVIISGNSRTIDRVVRREVFLAPNDLFNLTDFKDSINALKRTGYFENAEIEQKRVSSDKMDLIVKVSEAPTGNIMVGGGYGSYGGVLLNAAVSDKNVFGSGIDLGLSLDYSSKYANFDVSAFNPRIYDSDYSGSINAYKSEFEAYDYTDNRTGAGIGIGKYITRHLKANLSYQYVISELTNVENDYRYYEEGEFVKSSISPSLTYNNTDDYFLPRRGVVATTSVEFAGIGGDMEFVKSYTSFGTFYGLRDIIDYDLILRYKAKLGWLWDTGYLPVTEKFYIGGIRTVRGYESGSIAPKDEKGRLIGAEKTFSNSVEASIPLIESAKMRLAFFYDYGMIGDDSLSDITRSGTGMAIEWISPVGPINLIFAKALDNEAGDRTASFEFTLGQRF